MHMAIIQRVALIGLAGAVAACGRTPATEPARTTPPPPLPAQPIEFPDVHETRLPSGLQLIVVEHRVQPVANVSLYIRSGAAAHPAQQAGLAALTADMLTKGTTTRTATQIAEAIEGVGGSLTASAGDDWLTISTGVLAEHLPLAFEIVSDMALRPTFPEDEIETARRRTLSGLQAALGQPAEIARRRFVREVYGPEHPYGVSAIPGSIEGLQQADLVQFHREHFAASNALLVVSGAVTPSAAEALARRHFGAWPRGALRPVPLPELAERPQTTIYLVHRPGSVQSTIWVGHAAVRPGDPDFFALQVLNRILGGGTDARLFQILREERGWTYGAYSRFTRPRDVGFFAATAEVRTEVTADAVAEIMRQLERLRDDRVPAEEVEAAKSYLAGSFPLRIETAAQIAEQVAQARLLGVPLEEVTRYVERIQEVTPDDVRRAAQAHIRPDRAAIVVVGDADRVLASLEPLAPVRLYDVEGERIERAAPGRRAPARP